ARYKLRQETVGRLSDEIYELYRQHVAQKSLLQRQQRFDTGFRRDVRALAARTARSPSPDAREYAAHMTRLDKLERRKGGPQKATTQASAIHREDLSPQEKRRAKRLLGENVLPGKKVRQPALEVNFLRRVAAILERESGRRIHVNSFAPHVKRPAGRTGRH